MKLKDLQFFVRHRLTIAAEDSEFTEQITVLLNQNYKRLVLQEELAIQDAPIDFTAGVATFTLPLDCGRVQNIQLVPSNKLLDSVSRRELAEIHAANAVGATGTGNGQLPGFYALEPPTQVRMEPAPSDTVGAAAILWYVQRPPDLANPDDSPDWIPEEFHEILGELTIVRMAATEEEVALANEARMNADSLRDQMRRWSTNRQAKPGSRPALLGYDRAV